MNTLQMLADSFAEELKATATHLAEQKKAFREGIDQIKDTFQAEITDTLNRFVAAMNDLGQLAETAYNQQIEHQLNLIGKPAPVHVAATEVEEVRPIHLLKAAE